MMISSMKMRVWLILSKLIKIFRIFVIMAYYIDDKQIVESIDINHVLDYFKDEECIRIMYGRGGLPPYGDKDYYLSDSLIIEPLADKFKYIYQDGSRVVSIDRNRGQICVNPYFDKTGIYDTEHSLSKNLRDYILDYKSKMRDIKIKEITNEI